MAALDDYLDDDVDDAEEPDPEQERVPLPRKVKKLARKRGSSQKALKELALLRNQPSSFICNVGELGVVVALC